ncbi:MAG: restriction endonuclease, partial [Terriglobia bacterium]
ADDGQFPDIKQQIIEVKLQTSPTIDLGLVTPDSLAPLDLPIIDGNQLRHCDVRYALFFAEIVGRNVVIRNVYLITGQDFFSRFPRFGGKVLNKKLQIPLPRDFL